MGLWGKCLFCKPQLSPGTGLQWYVGKHADDNGSDSLIPLGVITVGIIRHPDHTLVMDAN